MGPPRSISRILRFYWLTTRNFAYMAWLRLWHNTGLVSPRQKAWLAVVDFNSQHVPHTSTQMLMGHVSWVLHHEGRKRALDACDAEIQHLAELRQEALALKARLTAYPP